ncbi:MAG: alcohol dehydrogenase catalytic domain-containing protein [Aestuariivirga sp.]
MRYLTCQTHGLVSLADIPLPKAGEGEMIVQLSMCGICGTDTAKVFGAYPKPQKLGHEVVGIVHEAGDGVTAFRPGDRVALAHHAPDFASHYSTRGSETMDPLFKRSNIDPGGFSEFIRVPELLAGTTVFAIPDGMPDERAVFMEPMACCLRALDRMTLQKGDSCLVVGVGAVGILFMPLLEDCGVSAIAADMRDERIALARNWGAAGGCVPGRDDVAASCMSLSKGRGCDAVILTAVTEATLKLAVESVRDGGTIVLFGGKPGGAYSMPLWDVWLREINVISSYSATPDGLKRALDFLGTKACDGIESLVSHRLPLAEAQTAFELFHRGAASKVVIVP